MWCRLVVQAFQPAFLRRGSLKGYPTFAEDGSLKGYPTFAEDGILKGYPTFIRVASHLSQKGAEPWTDGPFPLSASCVPG